VRGEDVKGKEGLPFYMVHDQWKGTKFPQDLFIMEHSLDMGKLKGNGEWGAGDKDMEREIARK